jgi:hypothetical protein
MDTRIVALVTHFEARFLAALSSNPRKLAEAKGLYLRACALLDARIERRRERRC